MLRLAVVLIPSLLFGETAGGHQPGLIAALMPYVLMGLLIWFFVRRSRRKSRQRAALGDVQRQRPPTARQMAYIDLLMEEREIDTWMLEKEPETIQEASVLIDELKKRPIRQGDTP